MNYRTTRIYLRSLDLIDLVARIVAGLPPGYAFLADQIRRSASSIPFNSAVSTELRSAGQDVCDHLIAMLRRFR